MENELKGLDRLYLLPVFGLCGSGKTECMDQLAASGQQVLSVESVAGVRGVCISGVTGEATTTQPAFDQALAATIESFDPGQPVWIEWKAAEVTGLKLPAQLVDRVRKAPAVHLDVPIDVRIGRLTHDYAPWKGHLDLLLAKFVDRGMSGPIVDDLAGLVGDHTGFVRTLLVEWLDVRYQAEAEKLNVVFRGTFLRTSA